MPKYTNSIKRYRIDGMIGLNKEDSRWNLPINYYNDLLNAYVDIHNPRYVKIKMRPGLTKLTGSGACDYDIDSMIFWNDTVIVHDMNNALTDGNKLYHYDSDNSKFTSFYTGTGGSGHLLGMPKMAVYDGSLIIPEGGLVPRKSNASYTVTALTTDTTWADSLACHTHNQRLVYIYSDSTVILSRALDATGSAAYSTSMDSLDINVSKYANKNGTVLGVDSIGDNLIIIMDTNILVYYIPTIIENAKLTMNINIGCISKLGFAKKDNSLFFMARDGLYSLSPSQASQDLDVNTSLSLKVHSYWKDLYDALPRRIRNDTVAKSAQLFYATRYNQLWCAFNKGATTYGDNYDIVTHSDNEVLVYSLNTHHIVGRYIFNEGGSKPVYFCEDNDGTIYVGMGTHLYKFDSSVYTDDSTTIRFAFKPAYLGKDTAKFVKELLSFSGIFYSNIASTLSLSYKPQGIGEMAESVGSAISESISLVAGTNYIRDYDLIGRGRLFEMDFSLNTNGVYIEIGGLNIDYILEGIT